MSLKWRCFKASKFEKVFWTYSDAPALSSNGIVIEVYGTDPDLSRLFRTPNISVFDRDGLLPVNLQRTGLQGPLPFQEELLRSISEDLVAHALVDARWGLRGLRASSQLHERSDWGKWLIGRDGFVLNELDLLRKLAPRLLLVIIGGSADKEPWGEMIRSALPADALIASYIPHVFADSNPRVKGIFQAAIRGWLHPRDVKIKASNSFIPDDLVAKIKTLRPGKQVVADLSRLEELPSRNQWRQIGPEIGLSSALTEAISSVSTRAQSPIAFCALQVEDWSSEERISPVAERWLEIIPTPLVPFSTRLRTELGVRAGAGRLDVS